MYGSYDNWNWVSSAFDAWVADQAERACDAHFAEVGDQYPYEISELEAMEASYFAQFSGVDPYDMSDVPF